MRTNDRKKKKRRFNLEDYMVFLWTTTMIYILAAGFLGVLSVAFLIFNFVTIGNLFVMLTKVVSYTFAVNMTFAAIVTGCFAMDCYRDKEK
jgi:hypothetical protein